MKTEHTPGPWAYAGNGNITTQAAHYGFTVASVDTFTGRSCCPDEERRANARLIAAAPDMLAALEGLLTNAPAPKSVKQDYHYMVSREAAKRAIAKARGESK